MKYLNFEGEDLDGKHFNENRRFFAASFQGSHLKYANFWNVDLKGADFRWADLYGANFHSSNLHEANFKGAKIQGANFKNCSDLNYITWEKAEYNKKTVFPERFEPDEHGMKYRTRRKPSFKFKQSQEQKSLPSIEIKKILEESQKRQKATEVITQSLHKRQGRTKQGYFRERLLQDYNYQCAISKCSVHYVLEAAHIKPYSLCNAKERSDPNNGILLRSDLHILFDLNLIIVNPFDGSIEMSQSISYSLFDIDSSIQSKLPIEILRSRFPFLEWRYQKYENEIGKYIRKNLAQD